jgi:hypothetical protein
MIYLIKCGTKYGTVTDDGLMVRYTATLKTKRVVAGMFREVEQVGVDKSTVDVTFKKDTERRADGTVGFHPNYDRFRLLDRNSHIRVMRPDDIIGIEARDAGIDDLKRQLAEARRNREDHIRQAWRRAFKVDLATLEEPARETSAKWLQKGTNS